MGTARSRPVLCLARCYCGDCPHYVPMSIKATNTPDVYTAVDRHAILSSTGRRTNLAEFREAQRQARQAINQGGHMTDLDLHPIVIPPEEEASAGNPIECECTGTVFHLYGVPGVARCANPECGRWTGAWVLTCGPCADGECGVHPRA